MVITRAVPQSAELVEKLLKTGAIAISLPLVCFAPPEDLAPLDKALARLDRFDWVLFTSANAVQAVESRSATLKQDRKQVGNPRRIAAVGPATRHAAENAGFPVDYVARTHLGVALANELSDRLRDQEVFLPRSNRANPDLPATLRNRGAKVTEVIAYRTLPPTNLDHKRLNRMVHGEADAVLFFSPTAVQNFGDLVGRDQLVALQDRTAIAAVGPVTAAALRDAGVQQILVASDATADAVVHVLETHFSGTLRQFPAGAKHE